MEVKQEPLSDVPAPFLQQEAEEGQCCTGSNIAGPEQLSWSLALLWVLLLGIRSTWK